MILLPINPFVCITLMEYCPCIAYITDRGDRNAGVILCTVQEGGVVVAGVYELTVPELICSNTSERTRVC